MNYRIPSFLWHAALCALMVIALPAAAVAQIVPAMQMMPGPADAARVKPEHKLPKAVRSHAAPLNASRAVPVTPIPAGAKNIHLTLKKMHIIGATVFPPATLAAIYAPYLNRDITLDTAYLIAGEITQLYRDAGYFLSIAYLPEQRIDDGDVTIQIVEGYIGRVDMPQALAAHDVVQAQVAKLKTRHPLDEQELESFLLRLSDMPGHTVSGTLSPLEGASDGAVILTLEETTKKNTGEISFDNYSSRFLGPNEISASYSANLLPLQQTTVSALTGLPTDELKYIAFNHVATIAPDITLDVTGSHTRARPGYTLEPFDIESDSTYLGLGLGYQWIRQRQENLALKMMLDSRKSDSDLLNTPFTRDRIRALRANVTYDAADRWQGSNVASLTLSRGIAGLGSSKSGDINLSRAKAVPDFTKAEFSLARLQALPARWSALATASGQYASHALFSAEEFGYGGQALGRAYDSSEITGDHGLAGSMELRYDGWEEMHPVNIQPYLFYDIGKVWNRDAAQISHESGSSAGFGLRAVTPMGLSGNFGLAWPLTREIDTPVYGQNSSNPRILLKISQIF